MKRVYMSKYYKSFMAPHSLKRTFWRKKVKSIKQKVKMHFVRFANGRALYAGEE